MRLARQTALAASLVLAFTAHAATAQADKTVEASSVPEPNDLLLLGLGVVGLIVGRQVARKKADD